jgi:two-component system, chemotaxis family, CheB/CheR fusion protein
VRHTFSHQPPVNPSVSGIRILLVEDEERGLSCFAKLLRDEGYHVATADGFNAALVAASQSRFDLLVCDLRLSDGTGYDLMKILGAEFNMKGIAISGNGLPNDLSDCMKAGFHQHIRKPVAFDKVKAAIRALCAIN